MNGSPEQPSETEALREDLEQTRQRLAETVQELSRQLNVPRRIKDSADQARERVVEAVGHASLRVRETASELIARAKHLPDEAKSHPRATAAVGGAVALGVGAAAWLVGRRK